MRTHHIPTRDRAAFYTTQQLGRSRRLTPEGFLVCEGVPIARTGEQLYSATELPGINGNAEGVVIVERRPEEVFRTTTIASFEGKAITIDHPDSFITPRTFGELAVGHAQNVRRGEGVESDLLLADLIITDPEAIAYVNRVLPHVSSGYSADYEQLRAGAAVQRNIVGNHIALVECGRAGPRVAIRDTQETFTMNRTRSTRDTLTVLPKPTKSLVLGTVWEGGSAPRFDYIQEAPTEVVISLLTGEVIAEFPAEGGPQNLDPGRVWDGIASQLEAAAANARAKANDVRSAAGTQDTRPADFLSRSRAATASALSTMKAEAEKLWSRTTPQPTRDARPSLSSADQIRDINEANRSFWAARSGGNGPEAA